MVYSLATLPIDDIRRLCQAHAIQSLAVFGSALRDDFGADSDIDLLVEFEPEARVGFLKLAAVQRELGELIGRRVDLVPRSGLKPLIRDSVLASARTIYAIR
ncbi:MAG: nucleotidyltransferase family protein [Phycisphaerales bacterium]|nr:nucleotidyltransferase family protein [Phycisphaerales bacterium]